MLNVGELGGAEPLSPSLARFPAKLRFLFKPKRYKVLYGGRGAAKSWGVARALLIQAMQKKLLILCAREFQNSIEDSVHKLLSDQIEKMGLSKFYTIKNNEIEGSNGSRFIFRGLKMNVNSIKSFEAVDIVWVEEAQTVSKNSWDVLIPTIRRPNSEIWATFNPLLETDATYQFFVVNTPKDCELVKLNWSDNPFFDADGGILRSAMEHARNTDPDAWLNVWEGHCRNTLDGAIYAKELRQATADGRITKVPYDPIKGVSTVWDLGFSDATAIWFVQRIGFETRLIDFLEVRQTTVAEILRMMQDSSKSYVYDCDFLPHDAQAKTLAAHGKSIEQLLRAAGRKVKIVPKLSVTDGINAARTVFANCWFDQVKCADGLNALRHYRFDVDPETGKFSKNPVHDDYSHAADAFRYLSIAIRDPATVSGGPKLTPVARQRYVYSGQRGASTGWMG
jgi:phage terminase large subunit